MPGLGATLIGGALAVGSGLFAGGAARRAARSLSTNPDDFDPGSAAIDRLLGRQRGRNLGQESQRLARSQGFGFDQGQFEQSSSIRRAGANTFGKLGLEAREQGQERFATAAQGIRGGLVNEQQSAIERLMSQRLGARQFAIGTANNNRLAKIGIRGDAARNTFGPLGQIGGQLFGQGISSMFAPPPATLGPSPTNIQAAGGISEYGAANTGAFPSNFSGVGLAPASPGATGAGARVNSPPGSNQYSGINRNPFNPTGPYTLNSNPNPWE